MTHPWGKIAHLADRFGHGLCLIPRRAFLYLLVVTIAKGAAELRKARGRR